MWRHGRSCNDISIHYRLQRLQQRQHPPWARCTAGRTGRTGSGCRWSRCPAHCRRHAHPRRSLPRVLDVLSLVLSNDITMFHIYYIHYIYAACLSRCPHNLSSSSIRAGTLIHPAAAIINLSPSYHQAIITLWCRRQPTSVQLSHYKHSSLSFMSSSRHLP